MFQRRKLQYTNIVYTHILHIDIASTNINTWKANKRGKASRLPNCNAWNTDFTYAHACTGAHQRALLKATKRRAAAALFAFDNN